MGTIEEKGQSRRQRRKGRGIKGKKSFHFRIVRVGGFGEGQVLRYLWGIVRVLETGWGEAEPESEEKTGAEAVQRLEKQLHRCIHVEVRHHFMRHKHRSMGLLVGILCAVLCVVWLFGYQIGVDRTSGNSVYPYLNDGDRIMYSRRGRGVRQDDVIVFKRNGEITVKRVVGLSRDRMEMNRTGNRVALNGVKEREEYVILTKPGDERDRGLLGAPQMVMNEQYLVLGDNRIESVDSRDSNVGTVPSEDVLGKAVWIARKGR